MSRSDRCPSCGKFLDRFSACTIVCAHGWHTTEDGFKVHPEDAVPSYVRPDRDGMGAVIDVLVYDMKPKRDRKHRVELW